MIVVARGVDGDRGVVITKMKRIESRAPLETYFITDVCNI
jgi:hypothetical protein